VIAEALGGISLFALPRRQMLWNSLMEYLNFVSDILYLLVSAGYKSRNAELTSVIPALVFL